MISPRLGQLKKMFSEIAKPKKALIPVLMNSHKIKEIWQTKKKFQDVMPLNLTIILTINIKVLQDTLDPILKKQQCVIQLRLLNTHKLLILLL